MDYRKYIQENLPHVALEGQLVHHIDGDRENNDPENWFVLNPKAHHLVHVKMGGYRPIIQKNPTIRMNADNLEKLLNLYNNGDWI